MSRSLLASLLVLAAGCGDTRLSASQGGLVVDVDALELPATFVGYPTHAQLEVRNTSRRRQVATVEVAGPFVAAATLEVEGGSSAVVEVLFPADLPGDAAGTLRLSADGAEYETALHSFARAVPECAAVDACHASTFELQAERCVETTLPDSTPCAPGNACLEAGRCVAGVCLGAQKSCDDANACTTDACDGAQGCVHLEVSCPAPTDKCKVAACDPAAGCAVADAPDGTLCGPADCVTADVCLAGACKTVAVPEGFTCAPASPCQGKGTCHAQVCERPAATDLSPVWTYSPPNDRVLYFNGLADAAGNLYWAECSTALACELVSVTSGGFVRYRVALASPARQWLSSRVQGLLALVGGNVVVALSESTLEARRPSDGALVWKTDLGPQLATLFSAYATAGASLGALVDDAQGNVVVKAQPSIEGCGDSFDSSDALVSVSAATGAPGWLRLVSGSVTSLAADEVGNLYAPLTQRGDAGFEQNLLSLTPAGTQRWLTHGARWAYGLSVAGGRVSVTDTGGGSLFSTATGSVVTPASGPAAYSADPGFESLLASGVGFEFARPQSLCCANCPCPMAIPELRLVGFSTSTAEVLWDARLDPNAYPTVPTPMVSEPALTAAGEVLFAQGPDLSSYPVVNGQWLKAITSAGTERFSCALPPAAPYDAVAYEAAALLDGRWVVATQAQCRNCLRNPSPVVAAFDVPGSAPAPQGWVAQRGNNARNGRAR